MNFYCSDVLFLETQRNNLIQVNPSPFLCCISPFLGAVYMEEGASGGIGAPYVVGFPFSFVLCGSFYMRDRVPLGGRVTLP